MSQPGEIEDLTRALRRDLERAWDLIVAEQTAIAAAWPTSPAAVREHRLALFQVQVLTLMDEVDAQAASTITRAMTTAYETGAWVTAISGLAEPTFTGISSAAITGLAQTTMDDLLTATSGVRETTKALIRELTRDQVINVLYTGVTPTDAARDMRRLLEKHRIHAVTYADGKRVGLAQYSEMVLRTKTAEAYQTGGLDQGEALGWDWWEIMDGPECIMPGSRFLPYGDLTQMVRAEFSGPAYRITARTPAGPRTLTVGPNHPVMTARGWVRAHLVTECDELVYDPRGEDAATLSELDLEKVPVVEDVFAAVSERSPLSVRAATGEDLHGDAVFCQREVDVVSVQRGLLVIGDAGGVKHGREGDLMLADADTTLVASDRASADGSIGLGSASARLVGVRGPSSPFLGSRPVVPAGQRLAPAEGDPTGIERGVNLLGSESEFGSHLSGREAVCVEALDLVVRDANRSDAHASTSAESALGVVEGVELGSAGLADGGSAGSAVELAHGLLLCQVETVERGEYHGVVFDATTTVGAYMADGFVVKNCGWTSHDDPQKANGMIVDIDAAKEHRLSHPSCRRSSTPRPDIASAREAAVALPTSPEALADIQARAVAAQAATRSTLPAPAGVAKTATVATPARAVTAATLARPVTQAS